MKLDKRFLYLAVAACLSLSGCAPLTEGTSSSEFVSSHGDVSSQEVTSSRESNNSTQEGSSFEHSSTSPSSQSESKQEGSSSYQHQEETASTLSSQWSGTEMPETQDIVILCAKGTGYNRIYAWTNEKRELTKSWPGDEMEEFDENWYAYRFENPETTVFNVIFNNGQGNQTVDLTDVVNGPGYYWFTKENGFFASPTMPYPGADHSSEVITVEGPKDYEVKLTNATDYSKFTFWDSHPASYWTCLNKYKGSRKDFRQESIYFCITTRFYNGDSSNDAECWDNKHNERSDPAWRGDFKGLIEKMDYIKALGFTAIWITPIVTNASGYDYHGYHSLDFASVDKRYESEDVDFQTVINEAHKRDMKICLDVVFNHTGNWGDETLFPMFIKDRNVDPDDMFGSMQLNTNGPLYRKFPNYASLSGSDQFQARIATMMNDDSDPDGIYHHDGGLGSWEVQDEQVKNIEGDCIDLNTENPAVAEYLVDTYGRFIRMGVDAFRIDTMKHINRLTLNKYFFPALHEYARRCRGDDSFFMFGEVCARVTELYNHGVPSLSPSFYTWDEEKEYEWGSKEVNYESAKKHYYDYEGRDSDTRTSNNVYLNSGYAYHNPDHNHWSGSSVIDFRMHRSLADVDKAYREAVEDDRHFNDATYNVTYVNSHDYSPEPDEFNRPSFTEAEWAEKLNLIFTFRGIPCLYYGTEVNFCAGKKIDSGTNAALADSGRAYFGDHLTGELTTSSFGSYTSASGNIKDSLDSKLAKHISLLNRMRQQVPALQMGQYSSIGNKAFVRRYTSGNVDSIACVVMSGSATFNGLPNGTYVDLITGDSVTGTRINANASGQGNIRVYVLNGNRLGGSHFAK